MSHSTVCADGRGFGYGNSYPSLDGHQLTDALIEILHKAQELFGYLDNDLLLYIAYSLKLLGGTPLPLETGPLSVRPEGWLEYAAVLAFKVGAPVKVIGPRRSSPYPLVFATVSVLPLMDTAPLLAMVLFRAIAPTRLTVTVVLPVNVNAVL